MVVGSGGGGLARGGMGAGLIKATDRLGRVAEYDGENQVHPRTEENAGMHGCAQATRKWLAGWRDAQEAARPWLDAETTRAFWVVKCIVMRVENKWRRLLTLWVFVVTLNDECVAK